MLDSLHVPPADESLQAQNSGCPARHRKTFLDSSRIDSCTFGACVQVSLRGSNVHELTAQALGQVSTSPRDK